MGNAQSYKSDLVSVYSTGEVYIFKYTASGLLGPGSVCSGIPRYLPLLSLFCCQKKHTLFPQPIMVASGLHVGGILYAPLF